MADVALKRQSATPKKFVSSSKALSPSLLSMERLILCRLQNIEQIPVSLSVQNIERNPFSLSLQNIEQISFSLSVQETEQIPFSLSDSDSADNAGTWQEKRVTIKADSTDHKGQLAITTSQESTIWFDQISAKPVETFKVRNVSQITVDIGRIPLYQCPESRILCVVVGKHFLDCGKIFSLLSRNLLSNFT
jgi:hypothetical protein